MLDRRRVLQVGIAGLFLTVLAAQALPGVSASYLLMAALACAGGLLIAATEHGPDRRTSLNLFVWALMVRLAAVTVCYALGLREGGPFLGPDSSMYYEESVALAASGFHLGEHPVVAFGSYDVSHYYLFAAAIRYLHADLFGLQVMNCGLIALAAPLMYGVVRTVMPAGAVVLGLVVAVHPSLVAIAAIDLLKDPSIIFATTFLIWIIVRLTRETRLVGTVPLFVVGAAVGMYLRMGRFYSFAYLEVALVTAAAIMMIMRVRVFQRVAGVAAVAGIFLTAEVLPVRASWPPSPLMVASSVTYVLGSPTMSQYAAGLFDRVRAPSASAPGEKGPVVARVHLGPETGTFAVVGSVVTFAANLFRRLYGPFIWIPPTDWHFKALQAGDYLLYPGMLVWYGLLPPMVAGLALTAWRILKRTETRFVVVFLWMFTAVYFAQYLAINLSYRQRDVMLPVLIVFAWIGLTHARYPIRGPWLYGAYWAGLVLIAGAHLVARAMLTS